MVDVTGAAGLGEPLEIVGWWFRPVRPRPHGGVLFCAPGGGWTKAYWHLEVAGHPGYSFAEFMTGLGHHVVTFDHLAVGESTKPRDPFSLTSEIVARANAAFVDAMLARIDAADGPKIGIGHSMGGMLTIRQQGRYGTFDAVAILGFSTLYPMNLEGLIDQSAFVGMTEARLRDLRDQVPVPYQVFPKDAARGLFLHDDVPDAVLTARAAAATNSPGIAGAACLIPGIVADDAARIDVPVFCGWAERDTSIDPRREVASYVSARDITLHVLAGSAHTTNLGTTRATQWARIAAWIDGIDLRTPPP